MTAGAEISLTGGRERALVKNAQIPLVAAENDGFCRRHGFQRRAGDPHKNVAFVKQTVHVGAVTEKHHRPPPRLAIDLFGKRRKLRQSIAAARDEDANGALQLLRKERGDGEEQTRRVGAVAVKSADREHGKGMLARGTGGKATGVDAVFNERDVLSRHRKIADQRFTDVAAYGDGGRGEYGKNIQRKAGGEHGVGGDDEGKVKGQRQQTAQKGASPCVGVNDVGLVAADVSRQCRERQRQCAGIGEGRERDVTHPRAGQHGGGLSPRRQHRDAVSEG